MMGMNKHVTQKQIIPKTEKKADEQKPKKERPKAIGKAKKK